MHIYGIQCDFMHKSCWNHPNFENIWFYYVICTSDPQNHCLLGSRNRVAVNFFNRYVIYWVVPCERARPELSEYVWQRGIGSLEDRVNKISGNLTITSQTCTWESKRRSPPWPDVSSRAFTENTLFRGRDRTLLLSKYSHPIVMGGYRKIINNNIFSGQTTLSPPSQRYRWQPG